MNIQNRPGHLPSLPESQSTPAPATAAVSPAVAETREPQPFDELKLDSPKIRRSIEKLERKGYFTVPVSQTTKNFMASRPVEASKEISSGQAVTFLETPHEPVVTAAATKLVSTINGRETRLMAHECEVRWPAKTGASDWHIDKGAKVLTCLTTVAGKPTQFVSPEIARTKFTANPVNPTTLIPTMAEEAIAADIQHAKKDKFYFFAAAGLKADNIPKLVHRAPGETGRTIFLARWKEVK